MATEQGAATGWWRRLARNRLLDVGAVALALAFLLRLGAVLPSRAIENDFAHYYTASRLMLGGEDPYGKPLAPYYARHGFAYQEDVPVVTNPPTLLWLFAPLAWMPPRSAFWVWVAVQAGSLAAILWTSRRLLGSRLSPRAWRLVVAGTVCSATVYWHFFYSQMQLPLAALVLVGYAWHRAGKYTQASLAIAAAGAIKLYPLILLPWFLWSGRDRAAVKLARGGVVLAALAGVALVTDLGRWREFFVYGMPPLAAHAVNYSSIFTWPSFLANLGYAAWQFDPPLWVARLWWQAGVASGLGLIALAYVVCLRRVEDVEAQFCLLCVAMIVGVFKAEAHYLVFVIFPMIAAAASVAARPRALSLLGYAGLLFSLNDLDTRASPLLDRHLYWKILINYIPLYGLLALGLFFASQHRRAPVGETTS